MPDDTECPDCKPVHICWPVKRRGLDEWELRQENLFKYDDPEGSEERWY
jgi:hypothetical protein